MTTPFSLVNYSKLQRASDKIFLIFETEKFNLEEINALLFQMQNVVGGESGFENSMDEDENN